MKIATFNANSLRARIDIVVDWLNQNKPDILCIQETKVQDHEFPYDQLDTTGYNYIFKGQKSYNGVAILSRHKIENASFGFDAEPYDKPRLARASIKGINIVNTYVPQGRDIESEHYQYKLQWFQRLKDLFDKNFKPADPVIWLGDINVAPTDIDVYEPQTKLTNPCFHEDVKKQFQDTIKWGFTDIFRLHNKNPEMYTFWDYRLPNSCKRNLGWRLDHILATKPLVKKSTACYIDKTPRLLDKPSDHTFLIAEFDV